MAGLSVPPVSPSLRALLPGLVGRERLDTAFALDALQLELVFISGPLLAAGIATAISPEVAVLTGVGAAGGGRARRCRLPASRRWRPAEREPGATRTGALGDAAGCARSCLALALTAVAFGVLEIGIAAFAEEQGSRDDAGWLFALWGVGSLAGGLWYGARQWGSCAARRFLFITAGLAARPRPVAARRLDAGVRRARRRRRASASRPRRRPRTR